MVNDGEVTMINQQWQTRLTAVKQENERFREELLEYRRGTRVAQGVSWREAKAGDADACTVGTTTTYPDVPHAMYAELVQNRDALLAENTQLREHLDRLRARLLELL